MTDLDTGPSSIRDDSICESSLHPNKSSGDIVERLIKRLRRKTIQIGVDPDNVPVFALDPDCQDAAAEIERLRRERDTWDRRVAYDELKAREEENRCTQQKIIDDLAARALTAESAVAAAWEEAADWLAREYPDNVNTNAFCAALRSQAEIRRA